jgi:hypothetical protein
MWAVAIHGGAGEFLTIFCCFITARIVTFSSGDLNLSKEEEAENIEYLTKVSSTTFLILNKSFSELLVTNLFGTQALKECTVRLSQGASALDVVEAAIVMLEDIRLSFFLSFFSLLPLPLDS